MAIDLNCDLGEGSGHDADVMPLVTSANIACGVHAGTPATMAATVALARRYNVAVGAHPGHADAAHFGRRELGLGAAATVRLVLDQVAALAAVAGGDLHHVKLHGGLYHEVSRDRRLADAVTAALRATWPRLVVYALAGSVLAAVAREKGLWVAEEAFIDRGYAADGTLVPRSHAAATIIDPAIAAARAVAIATGAGVTAVDGTLVAPRADTLCIHGDGTDPVGMARAVRAALDVAGIVVAAPVT